MAITPGSVAFSLPVQRRNPPEFGRFQRFSVPQRASARCAAGKRGGSSPSGSPRLFYVPGTAFERRHSPVFGPRRGSYQISAKRFGAKPGLQRATRAAPAAKLFQTGRRVMRQTVLPTELSGKTAPMRSSSSVFRRLPLRSRSARRSRLRFGLPLTPESGGPSRYPAAHFALTAIRASRLQEFQNAEQNVDRCHSPGRDPGCRGPWESRRRI